MSNLGEVTFEVGEPIQLHVLPTPDGKIQVTVHRAEAKPEQVKEPVDVHCTFPECTSARFWIRYETTSEQLILVSPNCQAHTPLICQNCRKELVFPQHTFPQQAEDVLTNTDVCQCEESDGHLFDINDHWQNIVLRRYAPPEGASPTEEKGEVQDAEHQSVSDE